MRLAVRIGGVFLCVTFWSVSSSSRAADEPSSTPNAPKAAAPTASTAEASASNSSTPVKEPPTDWIDPTTGHRVLRLSREPGTSSLYFHQNAYTDRGDKLFVTILPPCQGRGGGGLGRRDNTVLPGGFGNNDVTGPGAPLPDNAGAQGSGASQAGAQGNLPLPQGKGRGDGAAAGGGPRGGLFFPPSTMATIDLTTLGVDPPKIDKIGEGFTRGHVVGKKTRSVYYIRTQNIDGARVDKVCSTNLDTHETREIGNLPVGRGGSGLAINADETLLGGSFVDLPPLTAQGGRSDAAPAAKSDAKSDSATPAQNAPAGENSLAQSPDGTEDRRNQDGRLARRLSQKLPMKLFTVRISDGEIKTFAPSTDWLNHVQFSPTDPKLMMFCHEGPWHLVDRVWTVNVNGGEPHLMHPRTMPYEIAGHEFPGYDGHTVWYDLQTPRSDKFWLASVNVDTGERFRYPIEREQWSVHYNQSHDGKLFAGDGGGPDSVANRTPLPDAHPRETPGNRQTIYLFRPLDSFHTMKVGDDTVKVGKFEAEPLVDLKDHNYSLEPNLTFTPDNKWIIFRSNMHGPTHVYAVEIAKAK